ncbi:MAG TPA: carboxypeptidase regulatory-like domain-containing protein [Candidatus Binatia bacterium]|nr:carboxypeptidase regulatory-like domain-containing protein [Candidatus Binatia bacterium]
MRELRLFLLLCVLLLGATAVQAARIHGTVYNIELDPVKNARVEITTQPRQVFIATNGTYSFTVPEGSYKLTAAVVKNGTTTASAAEQVTVTKDGDYVLDLIVFPDFSEENLLNDSEQINLDEVQFDQSATSPWLRLFIVIIGFLIIAGGVVWWQRRAKNHTAHEAKEHPLPTPHIHSESTAQEVAPLPETERDDAKIVVDFIKSQGGRTTQKDIRKHSPLSEAKISLIITELEHKGIIEKIKKGRGNIIVLK